MDFLLSAIFIFTLTGAHARAYEAMSALTYWRSILPQSPIPTSILQRLPQEKMMHSFELKKAPTVFISYKCASTEEQIHNDPNTPLFFLKDSLKPGTIMTLDLAKITSTTPFLPIEKAKATPFTSSKLPEILSYFGIQLGSPEAIAMQQTLAECEDLPLDGERKRCVTSMEDMLEFIEAELGSEDVRAIETSIIGGNDEVPSRQKYVVGPKGGKRMDAEALVSCHPEPYPRALYYCHTTMNIEAYKVQLFGKDGVMVDAIATCHTNTSEWNPNYAGFKILNVKPGTEPICHFLPQGHIIFIGLSKMDTSVL